MLQYKQKLGVISLKDLRKLQETLKRFNGKDLYIRFNGSIRTYLHIYNAQCLVTRIVMLIGNGDFKDNQELEILTDDIRNIIYNENGLLFEMNGNFNIEIIN